MKKIILLNIFLLSLVFYFSGCRTNFNNKEDESNIGTNSISSNNVNVWFKKAENLKFIESNQQGNGHYQIVVQPETNIYDKLDLTTLTDELTNNISLYENDKQSQEAILNIKEKHINSYDNKAILLFDFSGSIINDGCENNTSACFQLKKSAKRIIDKLINTANTKIAIYYFNAKSDIYPLDERTEYPTKNQKDLFDSLDKLQESNPFFEKLQSFTFSTNLNGAIEDSTKKMCSLLDCNNKNIIKSIIIFSDGKDTANLITEDEMLKNLNKNIDYYAIGLKNNNNDLDSSLLKTIVSKYGHDNMYSEINDINKIEKSFDKIARMIQVKSNLYEIDFCPSYQQEKNVNLEIKFSNKPYNINNIKIKDANLNVSNYGCDLIPK